MSPSSFRLPFQEILSCFSFLLYEHLILNRLITYYEMGLYYDNILQEYPKG